jgi:hypothetical protein
MFELNEYLMAIVVENDLIGIDQYYLMKNYRKICFYCLVEGRFDEKMIIKTMIDQVHRNQYDYEIL